MATDRGMHEDPKLLTPDSIDLSRALVSLQEEIEAINWYLQRIVATSDKQLGDVLAHNKRDEVEHAMMLIEWIRRRDADFDHYAKQLLFSSGEIKEPDQPSNSDPYPGSGLGLGSLREGGE